MRCPIVDIEYNIAYGAAHVRISDNICDLYITISDGYTKTMTVGKPRYNNKGYLRIVEKNIKKHDYGNLADFANILSDEMKDDDEYIDDINEIIGKIVGVGLPLFNYDIDATFSWMNEDRPELDGESIMSSIRSGCGVEILDKIRER